MEEARALLDSAERGKRQTEAELAESRAAVNEMNTINSKVGHDHGQGHGQGQGHGHGQRDVTSDVPSLPILSF